MSDKFQARYQAQDGYAGGARPIHFKIDPYDLEEDMTDEELETFYYEACDEHFKQTVSAGPERVEEFVAWAKEQLKKRNE